MGKEVQHNKKAERTRRGEKKNKEYELDVYKNYLWRPPNSCQKLITRSLLEATEYQTKFKSIPS
jgi:hypothetical protein